MILPNLELLRSSVTPENGEVFDDIEAAGQRAGELVRRLMAFTRARGDLLPRRVSVRSIAERAVEMSRRSLGPATTIEIAGDGAASVRVDATSIAQALVNILLNAGDALKDRPAPRVWIELDDVGGEDSGTPASSGAGGQQRCARVVIRDNGIGMDEATQRRVFEPFFTNKPVGQGTGLGLATTYAIVREHRGSVECTSRAGEGTTFTIRLPIDVLPVAPAPMPALSQPAVRERILCVDDERLVRRAMARILTAAGYHVTEATDGDEALAAYDRPGAFDLILLDVTMPGCSGLAVRERVLARDAAARVVFITGDASTVTVSGGAVAVIEKPILRESLLGTIRRVLDGS